jgi:predicted metallopeptidase
MSLAQKSKVRWSFAPDIKQRIITLCGHPDFSYIDTNFLHCFRSTGSKAQAYARIWGLPQIFKLALNTSGHYCLEVISEKFDSLSQKEQCKVLIHELLHIPKTFSGSLLPHRTGSFHLSTQRVNQIYQSIEKIPPPSSIKKTLLRKLNLL